MTRQTLPARIGPFACALALVAAVGAHQLAAQAPASVRAATVTARKAPVRPAWSTPVGEAQLNQALEALLDRSVSSGRWGVIVVSLSRGDTLFGRNADTALLPASTMKVFTSAMALDYLGPTHQFETQVLREGALDSAGVLSGDLVLRGAGDPSLGAPFGADPMRILAREVAAAGIRQISGAIVGDGSAFDGRRIPDGWLDRYLGASYAARVSALSYNANTVRVSVRAVNGRAQVSLSPSLSGLLISNWVTVRPDSRSASIAVRQDSLTGAFRISGWIGASSPARGYSLMVEKPEMFAAAAFRAALVAEGVKVVGAVSSRRAAQDATVVTGLPSRLLSDLVTQMNGESNNHFAELLFRNVAASTGAVGSADSGNAILHAFLRDRVGASNADLFAADGSGLSTLDRITPRSLVSVLEYSSRAPWASIFVASLPVAGQTETLRARMRGAPAQGRLRAKTGSTNEVRSLGGYVTTTNGEELAFAFIYNGDDLNRAKAAIDAMGNTLASFAR